MTFELTDFLLELENYEFGIRLVTANSSDEAMSDELDNLLHARTYLEKLQRLYPTDERLLVYRPRLADSDHLLQTKRQVVLTHIPQFGLMRQRLPYLPPTDYWWWYLDRLDDISVAEQLVYLEPEQLGITLNGALVTQLGLTPGQQVTVTTADSNHLLISW